MNTTTQQRRDQLDATAETLTDLGLPSLAAKLRDVIDELLPEPTPARTPGQIAWEAYRGAPTVGLPAWERAAQAVIVHHEQQPQGDVWTREGLGLSDHATPVEVNDAISAKIRDELDRIRREAGLGPLSDTDPRLTVGSHDWTPDHDGHCEAIDNDFGCTRGAHDDGQHAAGDANTIVHAWTTDTPTPAPSWSPVVGAWAEHCRYGRVLVVHVDREWVTYIAPGRVRTTQSRHDSSGLSAPVPRVWDWAEDVPAGVVVTCDTGIEWTRQSIDNSPFGPFTEVVGGVW